MNENTEGAIFSAIHVLCGGSTSREHTQRIVCELKLLLAEIQAVQNTCELCGGTGVIEPESGDDALDHEYPCCHQITLELHTTPRETGTTT